MSDLYARILLWHKLVAMQTGGLALCSARHRLNRDEADGWATTLENVAADMRQFLDTGTFILDDKGQRVVDCVGEKASLANRSEQEVSHEVASAPPHHIGTQNQAVGRKAGGFRVATRKK